MKLSNKISIFFAELDLGEDWPESEDESDLTEYATEQNPIQIERKKSEVVRIIPDQRKSSTGSQVKSQHFLRRLLQTKLSVCAY